MDKTSLIGLGLIAAILISWLALTGPSKEQIARNKQIRDSIELATKINEVAEQTKLAVKKMEVQHDTAVQAPVADSILKLANTSLYKDFSVSASGKAEVVTLENENIRTWSLSGYSN